MNKFQKLARLYKDIELLENAGKIKAANILHKKFIREAQEYQIKPSQELMNEIFLTAQNPTNEYNDLIAAYNANRGAYTREEQAYIAQAIKRADKQRSQGTYSTSIQVPNPTVPAYSQTPVTIPTNTPGLKIPTTPQLKSVNDDRFLNTPRLDLNKTPAAQLPAAQQPTSPVNSDTANINAAMESMYSAVNKASEQQSMANPATEANENKLYTNSINQIAALLNKRTSDDRARAHQIYENTIVQFQNPKRKHLFEQQFQSIVSRNFPAGPII